MKKSENNVQVGDFVRLTDPLDNGTIVRIENVDEHGFASWLDGSQAADMEQVSIVDGASPIGNDIDGYYFTLSEIITEIERRVNAQTWLNLKKPFKVYPESAVEYWQHRAEKAEAENALNEKLLDKEHNKLLDAQEEIEKIKDKNIEDEKELRAVFFRQNKILVEQNKALENRRKEWEETADELNKELCKTQKERDELRERIKQLEADLEEGGFNDLKKDILTLVTIIPCNEENESIINDIKNLLK